MKIIFNVLKRIVISICLIYAFDVIASNLGIFIPINIFTILVVSSLGMCGLIGVIVLIFLL